MREKNPFFQTMKTEVSFIRTLLPCMTNFPLFPHLHCHSSGKPPGILTEISKSSVHLCFIPSSILSPFQSQSNYFNAKGNHGIPLFNTLDGSHIAPRIKITLIVCPPQVWVMWTPSTSPTSSSTAFPFLCCSSHSRLLPFFLYIPRSFFLAPGSLLIPGTIFSFISLSQASPLALYFSIIAHSICIPMFIYFKSTYASIL